MSVISPAVSNPVAPVFATEVDTLLEEMRYPDLGILRERVVVFKRIPRNASGYPIARPSDCMQITDAFDELFIKYERRFSTGDGYISKQFFAIVDDFMNSDMSVYPMEILRIKIVKAKALVACGQAEEALDLIGPYAQRPYLIEDQYGLLLRIIDVDTLARLSAGRLDELQQVSLGRLRLMVSWRRHEARGLFGRMAPVLALGNGKRSGFVDSMLHVMAKPILAQRRWSARNSRMKLITNLIPIEFICSLLASIIIDMTRKSWTKGQVQIAEQTEKKPVKTPPLQRVVPPGEEGKTEKQKPILVTRAMGGLGDLAMMTPGLNVLAQRFKRPVYFATKKAFFPVFENNPNVRLIDVDSYFDISQFRRWYNLSHCPATRYEAAVAPMIRKGRVETFARGMAVRRMHLNLFGWKPIVKLSEEQQKFRTEFRAKYGSSDRPLIGIQPFSRDSYKNCDAIFEAARLLSEKYRVVIMHTTELPIEPSENIIVAVGQPLREVIAMVAAMDYYIAVDSAFYHITAAFDVPTMGIFGPTNGKTLSKHHKRYHLVRPKTQFACAPCWRNENSPCLLTGNNHSACLNSISADHLYDEFEYMRSQFPMNVQSNAYA